MRRTTGKILSCLMAAAFAVTSVPFTAYAESIAAQDDLYGEVLDVTAEGTIDEEALIPVVVEEESSSEINNEAASSVEIIDETAVEPETAGTETEEVLSEETEVPQDKDGVMVPAGLLRKGADPDSIKLYDASLEEKELGFDAYGQVYTYEADGKTYTVLYIHGTDSGATIKLKDGYSEYITADDYYGDLARNTITDLVMDDNIENIKTERVFFKMQNLSYVRLSKKLKRLDTRTFEDCTSLTELTIPASLEESGVGTVDLCTSLKTVNFEEGMVEVPANILHPNGAAPVYVETVNLPASVKFIGDDSFTNQTHLTTVNFAPGTVLTRIGFNAFFDTNLESITLPKFAGKWYEEYDKVTKKWPKPPTISSGAFGGNNNKNCRTLIIPDGVGEIHQVTNGTEYFRDIYLPKSFVKDGLTYYFFSGVPESSPVKKIHFAGSKAEFFKALSTYDSEEELTQLGIPHWYTLMEFNSPAPTQVSGITAPSDKATIVKYLDDLSSDTVELTISPAGHLSTDYRVESSDTSIVEASLGEEDNAKLPLTLKYKNKEGEATVTVSGGLASATIKVIVKDKDTAAEPVFKLNGKVITDTKLSVKKGDWISVDSDTRDCVIKCKVGSGEWKVYPNGFTVGSDILVGAEENDEIGITAQASKDGLKDSKAASVTLAYTLDWGEIAEEDRWGRTFIPDGLWYSEWSYSDTPYYTGTAITCPELRVYWYNKLLKSGKDYTVKYDNNLNVSDEGATFTITCKGSYSGSLTGKIYIQAVGIDLFPCDYTPATLAYAPGMPETVDIGFVYDGKKLTYNKDYTLEYAKTGTYSWQKTLNGSGKYDVMVSGINNYSGSRILNGAVYVVNEADGLNMNDAVVSKIKPQQLKKIDEAVVPEFTVTYKGTTIPVESGAFEVSFRSNTKAGTAMLILTGKETPVTVGEGSYKFIGTKAVPFTINPINIKTAVVTVDDQTYTGSEVRPVPKVAIDGNTVSSLYFTWSYKKNVKAGTASVTVTGRENLTGKKTVKFKINKAALTDANVTLAETSYNYTVGGTKPSVVVALDGVTLSSKDYKVSYSNNNAIGTGTVTVTGKGSCTGKAEKTFTITNGNLGGCTTSFSDKIYSAKPKKYTQKLKIADTNGKKLKAGRDYDKAFVYTYLEDTMVKQKAGKKSYIDVLRAAGSKVDDKDIIPAGTTIWVVVNGKGNYAGTELTGSFRFGTKKVSSLKFSVAAQKFTGSRILPGKDQITVQKAVGDPNEAYEIIGYGTNVKTGNGTITVRGKGNYIGTKTIKFKITK